MDHWVEMIHWSGKWQPTPVFLPGEFHGQRSLAGYSPWGPKELDPTEHLMVKDVCEQTRRRMAPTEGALEPAQPRANVPQGVSVGGK